MDISTQPSQAALQALKARPGAFERIWYDRMVLIEDALKRRETPTKLARKPSMKIPQPHLPLSERILLYRLPLNTEQVATEVDVDRNTIYRWVRAGTIPVRRAGRFLKFDPGPLAKWAKLREFLPLDQW